MIAEMSQQHLLATYLCNNVESRTLITPDFNFLTVEFDEEPPHLLQVPQPKMASAEAVVDSGVDSEATTPSSPEDQESQEDENKAKQEDEDMVLETAETLLALSGKHFMKFSLICF